MTNPITAALLSAIRHSHEPMVVTDPRQPDHPMIAVNQAFTALTGYAEAEFSGRNCRFLQGPETDRATPGRIGRCLAGQRGCIEWIVNHRRDGTTFWNLLFISPVFDRDGTLLHYFGNQRDITSSPAEVPDHTFGMADMPLQGQAEFHVVLLEVLRDAPHDEDDAVERARRLERVVEAVRRVNELSLRLTPAPWSLPR